MIPKDIESTEQWQVRYEGRGRFDSEIVRTGTKGQMIFVARQQAQFNPIIERRTITVGAWEPFDPDAPEPEDDDEVVAQ